jgi:CRISPR type III-B/RAMP module-associated protein Cmr5
MRTLAQRRAAVALKHKDIKAEGQKGGDAISGFPMLIRTDGLLAALAFAVECKNGNRSMLKHEGEHDVAKAIVEHLSSEKIADAGTPWDLVEELSQSDASKLRRATAEALAFLNYLKRFVA